MKEKVYAFIYVSGYTSESEVTIFKDKISAVNMFFESYESFFASWLEDNCKISIQELEELSKEEQEEYEIFIEDFDISWDGWEVCERIYIKELEIN